MYSAVKAECWALPTIGEFKNGRGRVLRPGDVRRIASILGALCHLGHHSAESCHFEQALATDGGRTWEVNWIATDTRVKP